MEKYRKIWILYIAVFSIILGLFFFYFSDKVLLEDEQTDKPFFQIAFIAIIIAPIIEELIFRGYFSEKKYIKWAGIILLPIFIVLTAPNYLSISCVIFLYVFLILNFLFKNKSIENSIIIINALLFSTLHFSASDFNHVFSLYAILFIFALGLIATWLTINFGLLKAILFHFIWNSGAMLLVFFALQYPDLNTENFENEIIKMEWERSPIINNNKNGISYSNDKIIASNVTLNSLLNFLRQVEKDNYYFGEYYQSEVFMKYNFKIYLKDSTKNYSKSIIKYFQNEELLKTKNNKSNYYKPE